MNFGENILCPVCKTVSLYPYYSCASNCPLTISRREWETVRRRFEIRNIPCSERRTMKCEGQLIAPKHFIDHLIEDHRIKKMYCRESDHPRSLGVVYVSFPAEKLGTFPCNGRYFRWPLTYFEANSKKFLINAVYKDGNVFWWVIGDFSEHKPRKYLLESSLQLYEGTELVQLQQGNLIGSRNLQSDACNSTTSK